MDLKRMFSEINEVFRRYGVTKGVGFVPDELEIHLRRVGESYKLDYCERFSYLLPEVREIATDNAIKLLEQLGIPEKRIERVPEGVRVDITGDHKVVLFPVIELLIQNPEIEEQMPRILEEVRTAIYSLTKFIEFQWEYDEETVSDVQESLQNLTEIIEDYPEIQEEINEVLKKHIQEERE